MKSGKTAWRSPSNIAIVKYWGKKGFQSPGNPSVSMTLTNCYTDTFIEYTQKTNPESPSFNFTFQGKSNVLFEPGIDQFLKIAVNELPALSQLYLNIDSSNSFPHSAGIASSASSISALALCLCHINQQVTEINENEDQFFRKASHLARLGSGSACRSVYGGWVLWGVTSEISCSSDNYAVPVSNLSNQVFNNYYDAILIVNSGVKNVSSRLGHKLMESNSYKEIKFRSGKSNTIKLINALKSGNEKLFQDVTENEAVSLHAMFLTSSPYFVLIKPETLNIINTITRFRQDSGLDFSFTLDAGPNVHLLYPESIRDKMIAFINSALTPFCENGLWIDDNIGQGPVLLQI